MFKRKLFKRALPMILSVAMVFQSMPATAMAAEPETAIEQSTEEVVDDDADDNGAGDEEAGAGQNEGGTEESKSPETQTTEETKQTEETKAAEETKTAEETKVAEAETEEEVEEAADNAAQSLVTELSVTVTSADTSGTYSESNTNPFVDLLTYIKNSVTVTVNGENKDDLLKDKLNYKWQSQGTDGAYADMAEGKVPVDAGKYRLVISLAAIEGVCEAAEKTVDFEIKKAVIEVGDIGFIVDPSMTVKEFADNVKEDYTLTSNNIELNKATYVKSVEVVVKDALTGTAVTDEKTEFVNTSDYVATVAITLNDSFASNYTLPGYEADDLTEQKITVADLIETKIQVTNKLEDAGKVISKVYDGKEADVKTLVEPNITVEVINPIALEENAVIAEATYETLEKVWVDANDIELRDEDGKDYAPVDAGTYYLVLKYAGKEGVYAESEARVKVVIEPAKLIIKPVVDEKTAYYTAMSEQDVLETLDYKLYEVGEDGKAKADEFKIDRDTFWGVSYMDMTENQAYEPVFKLQYAAKDKDGNLEKDEDGNVVYRDNNNAKLEGPSKKEYRVVFTGKKAVYYADGTNADTRDVNAGDVNSAEPNYNVSVDAKTIVDNSVPITIADAKETTIDVSAILEDGKGAAYESPIERIYSGSAIYDERATYKKAVVKSDSADVAKNQDLNITYEWYKLASEQKDQDGKLILNWTRIHQANVYAPTDAGVYRLLISYADPEQVYAPSQAEVFYKIDPQFLGVVPSGDYRVYSSTDTNAFINKIKYDIDYKIYSLKENKYNPKENGAEYTLRSSDRLTWFIERENVDDAGNGTGVYEEYRGAFVEGYNYRLAVKLTPYSNNYANCTTEKQADNTEKTVYFNDTLDVKVDPMGETEVEITIDPTKLATTYKEYDGEAIDTSVEGFVTITKKADGSVVTDIPAEELVYYWTQVDSNNSTRYPLEVKNAGKYSLTVSFAGNDKYKTASAYSANIITITKRPLTITPTICGTVVAGMTVSETLYNRFALYDPTNVKVEGYAPADEAAFTYRTFSYTYNGVRRTAEGYAAWIQLDEYGYWDDKLSTSVYEKDKTNVLPENLRYRGNAVYEVAHNATFAYPYNINYDVTYERAEFTPVRGNAVVDGAWDLADSLDVDLATTTRDAIDGSKHTIIPMEGVPYVYDLADSEAHKLTGNYFVFRITAPIEFKDDYDTDDYYDDFFDTFVFENSIKAAGGHILDTDRWDGYIYVAFDADKDKNKETKSFDIRWEEGYTETFTVDLTKAILEVDLTKAVAPKSLAFNGVDAKMAVGETQQLDVKVTKEQISDIICLGYKVDKTEVLSITDTGYVTALQKGTATVTVYPARIVDGKKVAIAGAKTATTKITVSDVVTPSIKKVTAADASVKVEYADPANGYRREFYVLEGKNIKADTFESKIASIKNGAWEDAGFAIAPVYGDGTYNSKTKTRTETLYGLNPSTDYTVYVRNVSGVRTLDDGTQVAVNAVGAVKSFATTKSKVMSLDVDLTYASGSVIVNNTVKLSDKTVQASTEGKFTQYYEKDTADINNVTDTVWHKLPLTKDQQKNYVNPKLTYVVTDKDYHVPNDDYSKEMAKKDGATLVVGNRYFYPTKIATIAKNGKITLKGVGTVIIYAYDSDTGKWSNAVSLSIVADANSVKAKNAKVKVGVPIYLSDYLEYKEGKTKLTGAVNYNLFIEDLDKVNNENFSVTDIGGDYIVVAKKPGTIEIPVKDLYVEEAGGNGKATIKVTAAVLDPVKNLKAVNVVDDYADITFTYTAGADYNRGWAEGEILGFNIDLKDNRGSVIRNEQLYVEPYDDPSCTDNSFDRYGDIIGYDRSSNTYTFKYRIWGLTRLSNYKVTVTAIFGDPNAPTSVSKAANVKIKTTDIPASDIDLGKYSYGGIGIYACHVDRNECYWLNNYPYFTSGNTYTLQASADSIAASRQTDTLTWKSTNTKVATIKANPGTYTATFKALKSGTTKIEVTSKITKKVIARYYVYVKAVGEADDFYGDYDVDFIRWDPSYANGVEVLTAANPVEIAQPSKSYKWVSFTAPEFGIYSFNPIRGSIDMITDVEGNALSGNTQTLSKGEKVYLKLYGDFKVTVSSSEIKTLTAATPVSVSNNGYNVMSFKALEDNYYTFSADNSTNFVSNIYLADKTTKRGTYSSDNKSYSLALDAGEEIFLYVRNGNYTVSVKSRENTLLSTTATSVTVKKGEEKWFVYTAPETGDYTFKSEGATAAVKADYYTDIQNAEKTGTFAPGGASKDFAGTKTLTKGDTVAIRVYTDAAEATANISVSPKTAETLSLNTEKPVTVKKGETQWLKFSVTEDGLYSFDITGADSTSYYKNGIANTDSIGNKNVELKAGDIVYICVKAPSLDAAVVTAAEGETDTVVIKVKVTKLEASLITAGTAAPMTLSDGGEYWFVFTAPEYGRYTFNTAVTKNETGASHSVEVKSYDEVGGTDESDFGRYNEKVLKAGEEVVLKITAKNVTTDAKNPVTTSASITVAKVNFEAFTNNEASLALTNGSVKWYSFTAPKDGTYTFKKAVTEGTVDLYAATAITANFNLISSDSAGYDLKAGNTVYFKVVQTSGETTSAGKITVSVPTATEFTETATATLKKDVSQWFKFTAPKSARYLVTTSVAEEAVKNPVTVELYKSLEGTDEEKISIDDDGKFFKAGKTVYFKLTTDADTATTTLSVKPIVAAELTAGTPADVTVKAGTDKWYKFTAPANGRYEMNFTIKEGSSGIQTNVYTDNAKEETSDFTNNHLKSGDTYYIRVSTSQTTDQSGQLEVKAISAAGTLSLTAPTNVTLAKDETKWYTFTATEAGTYTFSTDAAADSTVTAKAYLNTDENSFATAMPFSQKLNKDEIVSIALSAEKAASFNVTVEKKLVTPIKVGETSVTIKKGDEKFFSFKPYNDGRFVIKSAEIPTGAKIAVDNGTLTSDGFKWSGWLNNSGDKEISLKTDSEAEITFKIVVERQLPTDNKLAVGEDKKLAVSGLAKGDYIYVSFTAPEDGMYSIKSDSTTVAVNWQECDEQGDEYSYSSGKLPIADLPLVKGTTKIYKVSYTPGETSTDEEKNTKASFNLIVSKVEPTAITGNSATVELEAGADKWYSYTATKAGRYTFNYGGAEVDLYKSLVNTSHYSGKSHTLSLAEKATVYLHVTNDKNEKATVQISVSTAETKDDIVLTDGENNIIFDKYEYIWLKYTAKETGMYTFSSGRYFDIYDGNKEHIDYDNNFTQFLDANTTVYFYLYAYSGNAVRFTAQKIELKKLTVDKPIETSVEVGEDSWFEFTAPSDGAYRFYSSSVDGESYLDTYGTLYLSDSTSKSDDSSGGNGYFAIEQNLTEGETVTLDTRYYYRDQAVSYIVNVEKIVTD